MWATSEGVQKLFLVSFLILLILGFVASGFEHICPSSSLRSMQLYEDSSGQISEVSISFSLRIIVLALQSRELYLIVACTTSNST